MSDVARYIEHEGKEWRILLYPEEGEWTAIELDHGLARRGDTIEEAESEIRQGMSDLIEMCNEFGNGYMGNIDPAIPEHFDRYEKLIGD